MAEIMGFTGNVLAEEGRSRSAMGSACAAGDWPAVTGTHMGDVALDQQGEASEQEAGTATSPLCYRPERRRCQIAALLYGGRRGNDGGPKLHCVLRRDTQKEEPGWGVPLDFGAAASPSFPSLLGNAGRRNSVSRPTPDRTRSRALADVRSQAELGNEATGQVQIREAHPGRSGELTCAARRSCCADHRGRQRHRPGNWPVFSTRKGRRTLASTDRPTASPPWRRS